MWHENSIHVKVGFRPGSPEVTMRNRLLGSIKSSPQHQKLFDGPAGAIHPTLGPEPDDIVVTKHCISAFAGADLQMRHAGAFRLRPAA